MSKRRRRKKRDPRSPRTRQGEEPSAEKARLLAELARKLDTTDSLTSEEEEAEDGDFLTGAMSYAHRNRMVQLWKRRGTIEEGAEVSEEDEQVLEDLAGAELENESDEEALFTDEEDERTAAVMDEHPEFHKYFENPDLLGEDGTMPDGANPFAHVSMHVIVENQLSAGDPPEVRRYLDRFMATGLSRHEAIHHIARAVSSMLFHVLSEKRPHDNDLYLTTLEEIAAEVEGEH